VEAVHKAVIVLKLKQLIFPHRYLCLFGSKKIFTTDITDIKLLKSTFFSGGDCNDLAVAESRICIRTLPNKCKRIKSKHCFAKPVVEESPFRLWHVAVLCGSLQSSFGCLCPNHSRAPPFFVQISAFK
jgi:hypothetical protein